MVLQEMFCYEFKQRKRSLFLIFVEIMLFLFVYAVARFLPQTVISVAKWINSSDVVRELAGIDEKIEAVTYMQIMFSAFLILFPVIIYRNMTDMIFSIRREEVMGTIRFFLSQSVSRTKLLVSKLVVSVLMAALEMSVLGIFLWRFSLTGVNHEVLTEIVSKNVRGAVLMSVSAVIIAVFIGFFYGCLTNRRNGKSFVCNLLFTGYIMAMVPNVINVCRYVLEKQNVQLLMMDKMAEFFEKLRSFNMLHLSNPFVSGAEPCAEAVCVYGTIGIVLLMAGGVVYGRKEIY